MCPSKTKCSWPPSLANWVVVGRGLWTVTTGPSPAPRAMVENHCKQIKAVLSHLLPSLQSQQERERKAAILIFTEVGWGGGGEPSNSLSPHPPASSTPSRTRLDLTLMEDATRAAPSHSSQMCTLGC
jgi:hypothetical protein